MTCRAKGDLVSCPGILTGLFWGELKSDCTVRNLIQKKTNRFEAWSNNLKTMRAWRAVLQRVALVLVLSDSVQPLLRW